MQGHVAVMNDNSEMLAVLHKGGFFGELALLATARRTAQCVALCHCDLTLLMAHDLVAAMKDFPDSAEKVGGVGGSCLLVVGREMRGPAGRWAGRVKGRGEGQQAVGNVSKGHTS